MSTPPDPIQERLDEPMRWVGMYVAAASAVCALAITADAFNGFWRKRLWFPCKYFSLNATTLTLLAVSMKLPVDRTSDMRAYVDRLAKLSSEIFLCIAMGNFIPSMGSMNDKELLTNVTALGILVITIFVNVRIQLNQLHLIYGSRTLTSEESVATILIFLLFLTLVSSATAVPATKRHVELRYQEMLKVAYREEQEVQRRIDEHRGDMKKYWVMAKTGSPQFVIARTIVCTSSSALCLLSTIILAESYIQMFRLFKREETLTASAYAWSTYWILAIQSLGVAVDSIAPTLRWFTAVNFKYSELSHKIFKNEFKFETYWIQRLVDRRESSLFLQIQHFKCGKYIHGAKGLILNSCIGVQILVVLLSKLIFLISASITVPFFLCFTLNKKLKIRISSKVITSNNHTGSGSGDSMQVELSRYVLLLEGEAELPEETLKNIFREADIVIQTGKRRQPKNLINLVHKFGNFLGVREFDKNQVPSLHSQEPPNCWSLPIVTLSTIAISLPNISKHKTKQLVRSVSEGLPLVVLIENSEDANGKLQSIRSAADVVWVGLVLHRKWQGKDLHRTSIEGKSSKVILQELAHDAEKTVREFQRDMKDWLMENPVNWPVNVIAANSMYRISQTILLAFEGENEQTDEELFEQLTVMIADILAACLTNLARVIANKCHRNAIKEREKNVHEALFLLGKTEELVELLQQRKWPCINPDKAACIEEWRALLQQSNENPAASTSTSSNENVTTPVTSGEQVAVAVDF